MAIQSFHTMLLMPSSAANGLVLSAAEDGARDWQPYASKWQGCAHPFTEEIALPETCG